MYPLAIVLLGVFLMVGYAGQLESVQNERYLKLTGDAAAVNFFAYRTAVVNYLNANPGASGTIPDGSLTWLTGFIRDSRWTNVVSGGTLYVYSTAPASGTLLAAVAERSGRYVLAGTKHSSGNLLSVSGASIAAGLPAGIPVGALVFIGA